MNRWAHIAAAGALSLLAAGNVRGDAAHLAGIEVVSASARTMTRAEVDMAGAAKVAGARPSDGRQLIFAAHKVSLVVSTGPENDMLSYRIGRLRNPTIVVRRGAILDITFINTDGDMVHDLRFTKQSPPFGAQPERSKSVGSRALPHVSADRDYAERILVRAGAAGRYTYFCTMKGHAKGGMYGTLIVR